MTVNVQKIRDNFPSLSQNEVNGVHPVFFDNPAGTQVPQSVIDAVSNYYRHMNANHGGMFATSQRSDQMLDDVRQAVADFINAPSAKEIVFGPSMTNNIFGLSRALVKTFSAGDEIVITRMDHDANVTPWTRIAEDHDLVIRWADINPDDCTLDMASLEAALTERTKVVATVHASNAAGTINPVQQIADMAHAVGAYYIVDAVQSAPHIPIDVQAIGCDFFFCSSYKFFGPHLGIMWGKYDLLASLPAYKVRPAEDVPPYRWETGTPSFETIAAVGATIDYLAGVGRDYGADYAADYPDFTGRALELKQAMAVIGEYENELVTHMLDMLNEIPGVTIYGINDKGRLAERVPTVICTVDGYTAKEVAKFLGDRHIYVWHGHYYAVEIMERLGHSEHGMVRIGLAHYNTHEEIDRLEAALRELVS